MIAVLETDKYRWFSWPVLGTWYLLP